MRRGIRRRGRFVPWLFSLGGSYDSWCPAEVGDVTQTVSSLGTHSWGVRFARRLQ